MTEQSEAPPWEQAKSHSQLWLDRAKAGSREEQNALAPQEHKAFAKELVSDKPWMAPSLAVAIPAYQVQKVLTGGSRSDPSLKQVTEAYKGIGEGLADAVSKPWEIAKEWAKKLLQGDSQPGPTNPTNSRKKQPTEAPSGPSEGYKNEKEMKKAAQVDVTPVTDTKAAIHRWKIDLQEIDGEISKTKDPKIKAVLKEHKAYLLGTK